MGTKDERIDAYIAGAAPFARPILKHLRALVHRACPEVVETVKWRMPSFEYQGMLCSMAAFKAHASFSFWKHALVVGTPEETTRKGMGSFGRLTSLDDLPADAKIERWIAKAMKLNEAGVKVPREKSLERKDPPMHPEFAATLKKQAKARTVFEGLPPSHRREYLEWIAEAKKDETRARRIAQAIEWLREGKSRNWKYERC